MKVLFNILLWLIVIATNLYIVILALTLVSISFQVNVWATLCLAIGLLIVIVLSLRGTYEVTRSKKGNVINE